MMRARFDRSVVFVVACMCSSVSLLDDAYNHARRFVFLSYPSSVRDWVGPFFASQAVCGVEHALQLLHAVRDFLDVADRFVSVAVIALRFLDLLAGVKRSHHAAIITKTARADNCNVRKEA